MPSVVWHEAERSRLHDQLPDKLVVYIRQAELPLGKIEIPQF